MNKRTDVLVFDITPVQVAGLAGLVAHQRKNWTGNPPNSMNRYGMTLEGPEWKRTLAFYVEKYVAVLARRWYPEIAPLKKHPYGFIVDYEMGKQKSLATHFDSSDVTMNVCLGQKFKGGELVFYDGKKTFEIKPKVGQVIIHRGSHMHRAKPITSGSRSNLILWCAARKR